MSVFAPFKRPPKADPQEWRWGMYAFTAASGARVLLVDARPAYASHRVFVPYEFAGYAPPPLSATIAAPRRSAPRILRNSSPSVAPHVGVTFCDASDFATPPKAGSPFRTQR